MLALLEEVLDQGRQPVSPPSDCVARGPSLVDKAGEEYWLEYETRVNYAVSNTTIQ